MRGKIWLGAVLLFLSGTVIGALGAGLYVKHTLDRVLRGDGKAVVNLVMGKLSRDLGLTSQERARARPIVEEASRELLRLRVSLRPQVDAILDRAVSRVQEQLPPERHQRLQRLYENFKARRLRQQEAK